jgi:hypothetical protein
MVAWLREEDERRRRNHNTRKPNAQPMAALQDGDTAGELKGKLNPGPDLVGKKTEQR